MYCTVLSANKRLINTPPHTNHTHTHSHSAQLDTIFALLYSSRCEFICADLVLKDLKKKKKSEMQRLSVPRVPPQASSSPPCDSDLRDPTLFFLSLLPSPYPWSWSWGASFHVQLSHRLLQHPLLTWRKPQLKFTWYREGCYLSSLIRLDASVNWTVALTLSQCCPLVMKLIKLHMKTAEKKVGAEGVKHFR